ncbi:hypothetical protein M5D96_012378 [Drosophila gunungcola]|uniref:Uncharacterized protein n=1 Tax=Drosophila gunungcola TaxID=103775 RepID=A0A9Q0BJJ8_9MUSC|nr:hypothetical protein M5D96_012378 [Drosophila gunungcola]
MIYMAASHFLPADASFRLRRDIVLDSALGYWVCTSTSTSTSQHLLGGEQRL